MPCPWPATVPADRDRARRRHTFPVSARFRLVAGRGNPDFLDRPWSLPLDQWDDERMVRMARGLSRHVVRFADYDGRVYALKETDRRLAEREYQLLRRLGDEALPVVEAVGVVTERTTPAGEELGAVLITRYLDFAVPYRHLFGTRSGPNIEDRLVDGLVVLLVRLHLHGFVWGDCSLSNTLFRRDAGALSAYLVDAETGDLHASVTGGQREHDLAVAVENIGGELLDLQAGGRLPDHVDPAGTALAVEARYRSLWRELTAEEVVAGSERYRLDHRIRRLNDLGFDVEELDLVATGGGHELRLRPQVVEQGHHRRRLQRLTGLEVQENQARRLLNDLAAFRAALERDAGQPVPEGLAAYRWLTELFEPTVAAIPPELSSKLEPPELFHELLEHRWFLSEQAGREIGTGEAVTSYVATVLPHVPDEHRLLLDDPDADEPPDELPA
jgi:hypothetical protein